MSEAKVVANVKLPSSWAIAAIGEVASLSPKADLAEIDECQSVHFVPMAAVNENFGGIDISQLRRFGEVCKGYTSFREGDVLFAKITPCMENGKGALVPPLPQGYAFGSTEFHVLRVSDAVQPKWLANYLSQEEFRKVARRNMTGTAGQLRVPSSWLGTAGIPVAPIREQSRIVEKLDELLSDLDAGVAELKAAQRKLKRYRQSLLKAAVEGALTTDWREARVASGEPQESGAELLQRILTERRTTWEEKQLTKFAEQDKTPPKGWRAKYPEPVAPVVSNLPPLAEGWTWASLDQLAGFITSGSRGWSDYYAVSGATFIRSQNINKDWLDLAEIAFVNPPRNSEGARTRVRRGDLLLTITGANVGKSAQVDVDLEEAYVSQHVALIRPVDANLSAYLHLFLTCGAGGRGQLDKLAYGAGKPGLNLQQVLSVAVPVPSPDEMPELLGVIKSALDAAAAQTAAIELGLKKAAAQRKNIVKAAFAGQLVPQDPSDEPASELLARIRAAREAAASKTTASKRGHKARETA